MSQTDEAMTLGSLDETATLSSLTLIVSTGLLLASFQLKKIKAKRKHHADLLGNSTLTKINFSTVILVLAK